MILQNLCSIFKFGGKGGKIESLQLRMKAVDVRGECVFGEVLLVAARTGEHGVFDEVHVGEVALDAALEAQHLAAQLAEDAGPAVHRLRPLVHGKFRHRVPVLAGGVCKAIAQLWSVDLDTLII